MSKALVCIDTTSSPSTVTEELRTLTGVKEVHTSKGIYDVLAWIQASSMNELRETVLPNIRKVDNVKSTLILPIQES